MSEPSTEPPLAETFAKEVEAFLGCYVASIELGTKALAAKNFELLRGMANLHKAPRGRANYLNAEGSEHLHAAASALLAIAGETKRLPRAAAVDVIVEAFFAALVDMDTYSHEAVLADALARLGTTRRDDGSYVFPVVFAPAAHLTDIRIGPVRLLSKALFEAEHQDAMRQEGSANQDSIRPLLLEDWNKFLLGYDHLLMVEIKGYESRLGWEVAAEAGEFFLNFIRMRFSFHATRNVRLAGGLAVQARRSSLRVSADGELLFSSHREWPGTHFDDKWSAAFERDLGNFTPGIAMFLDWLVSGECGGSPVVERLRYASGLIAEAYSQPHEHVRLVRTVAALEALALIKGSAKAASLAIACQCAGGWGVPDKAAAIHEAVKNAYAWRNAVVHGDAPDPQDVRLAFLNLEQHLLEIFLGFLVLFVRIQRGPQPRTVIELRQELQQRLPAFFESPKGD